MSSFEVYEFCKAIARGDSHKVGLMISRGSFDVNVRLQPQADRPPALVHAARHGQAEIVDILLRANARVDDIDASGRTACHAAAMFGRRDVLALLLARQPNLAALDADGRNTFFYAARGCENGDGRCALMLLEAGASLEGADPSDLCQFAATSAAAIEALIKRGVVVRQLRNVFGGSSLHSAAARCRAADMLDMLVNVCGIDLETRDRYGGTCLRPAASCGNVFALRWLINAGADTTSVASDGSTPLHNVTRRDCAIVLLAGGANARARDNRGRTALHQVLLWAAKMCMTVDVTAVHALLAAGADPDAADDFGNTSRQLLARAKMIIDPDQVEFARRDIAKARLDFVRHRALQVCIGLQSLELDALQMCEILQFACGPVAELVPFHIWWTIATTVKHFRTE